MKVRHRQEGTIREVKESGSGQWPWYSLGGDGTKTYYSFCAWEPADTWRDITAECNAHQYLVTHGHSMTNKIWDLDGRSDYRLRKIRLFDEVTMDLKDAFIIEKRED